MSHEHVEYFDGAVVTTERGALVFRLSVDDDQQVEIVGALIAPTDEHVLEAMHVLTRRNIRVVMPRS